jgi:hypothetical protein
VRRGFSRHDAGTLVSGSRACNLEAKVVQRRVEYVREKRRKEEVRYVVTMRA